MSCALGLIASSVALCAAPASPRLTGTPFMQVWHTEDFGASPINWRVLQHPASGLIYVGNSFGVLEYDGATWRLIPLPREGAARALAVDRRGRVWAAGNAEIAVLEPDVTGALHAVDQTARLPAGDRVFGVINRALAAPEGMYLSGDRRIFLFCPDGAVRVWRTEGNFSPIWELDDGVYVARDYRELLRLQPDGGARVLQSFTDPDAPLLRTYAAARDGAGRLLLTRFGPARWPDNDAPVALSAATAAQFRAEPARAMTRLADGRTAFGTVRGALVLGAGGEVEQRFDITHGLPVDTINGLTEDREGGLWLAMQNGVARLQLDSPFALHGLSQGLDSGPRRLTRWRDRLYVAAGSGVWWRDPADGRFHAVSGIRSGANRPVVVDDRLLVSTNTGVREIGFDGRVQTWSRDAGVALLASKRAPGWLLRGDSDGLWLLAPTAAGADGRTGWRVEGRLRNLPAIVVQIHDAGDGFVWVVGGQGEVWRVDFRAGLKLDAPCEQFDAARGVPAARRRDHVEVFTLGTDLLATGREWLRRFDAARERFTPAADLGLATGADAFDLIDANSLWLHLSEPSSQLLRVARPAVAAPWRIERVPAVELDGLILNSIFHDEVTRTLWIAGQGSLVSMDLDWHRAHPPSALQPLVRRVETGDGRVLFAGGEAPSVLHLAPQQNALRFAFAAPSFVPDYQGKVRTQYRTRVDGLDTDWSAWSTESYRDLTNLPYQALTFRVQTRAPDGRVSDERAFALNIAPPWWLTGWAFGGYALAVLAGVAGLVALRTHALHRRAAQLASIVTQRTTELAEKNTTLAAQNEELTRLRRLDAEEKIAARLAEEKARLEVLRYQLNPHFLFNALTSVCAQLPPAKGGARSMIERLTDFCRLTLFRPEADENPTLGDEMKMLRAYLEIEQARWGELLRVELAVAPGVEHERLPSFLLLPLVENALKYGGATSPGELRVRLVAWRDDDGLFLEVANTGEWAAAGGRGAVPSLGIGLQNLRQRLARYYPGAHEFSTESSDGWVRVRLRLATTVALAARG